MKLFVQVLIFSAIYFLPFGTNSSVFAQVPNNGFENWTDNNPDGWYTLDIMWDAVTPSNEAHSGSFAAKLEIIEVMESVMPPLLDTYCPVTQRYGNFNGYYKFVPAKQNDVLTITAFLYKGSIFSSVAVAELETNVAASSYTQFSIPFEYFSSETPDSAWIIITLDDTSETPSAGGYVLVDDLSFDGTTSVDVTDNKIPEEFSLKQNFPNPFNPSTKIEFQVQSESFVELKVYDILGKEVAALVNEVYPAGTFRADFSGESLPSGVYITKFSASSTNDNRSFTKTIKMNLIK